MKLLHARKLMMLKILFFSHYSDDSDKWRALSQHGVNRHFLQAIPRKVYCRTNQNIYLIFNNQNILLLETSSCPCITKIKNGRLNGFA